MTDPGYSDESRFGTRHTADEWSRLAETYVPQFMVAKPETTAADSLYQYMREGGYYIPRAYVREAWNEVKVEQRYAPLFEQWDPETPLPREWYSESSFKWTQNFAYTVRIDEQTVEGETIPERFITLLSDDPLSTEEIETEAAGYAARYGFEMVEAFPSIHTERAIHARGRAWGKEG